MQDLCYNLTPGILSYGSNGSGMDSYFNGHGTTVMLKNHLQTTRTNTETRVSLHSSRHQFTSITCQAYNVNTNI
jgi:hypothetical protein